MISDCFNELGSHLVEQFKNCFRMENTSIIIDLKELDKICLLHGLDDYEMINETLEEMFDEYNAMNSVQRDEVIDELFDNHICELNSIYARFPS